LALNSINRSMGQPDLYPFILTPAIVNKLGFIQELCAVPQFSTAERVRRFERADYEARILPTQPAMS
jgi:hypothetical protein